MTPQEFVQKWQKIQLMELSSAQQHFLDVCALVDHPTPAEADSAGNFFTFEASLSKASGKRGRADVWYKNYFIWEYKSPHGDLSKAYEQLLLYKDDLGNPPLLITSDTQTIFIHTNFTNTVKQVHKITFNQLLDGDGLKLLKWAFHKPEKFKPETTQAQLTKATADTFVVVAETLQKWAKAEDRTYDHERTAHFLIRLLFCLFAQDLNLLPDNLFTKIVTYPNRTFPQFVRTLQNLFITMRDGGLFGYYPIPYFDGGLFDDDHVPELPGDIMEALHRTCEQNWADVDPVIFGTLFERVIDENKRTQLGAHYTSESDIMLIVDPVLMAPLRDKWRTVRYEAEKKITQNQPDDAYTLLDNFATELSQTRVLDPACGSGNFLYTALKQLLSLQKEIIVFADKNNLPEIPLTVSPHQLYGIEINTYAHELAQITVWIGYLQWCNENSFGRTEEPILQPLNNIQHKDAILAYDDHGNPIKPTWPKADIIIGNPPFLGGKLMRTEFGDDYIDELQTAYDNVVPKEADLVCYWFERAHKLIERADFPLQRAGFIATNSIRGGANREVLKKIKMSGDIFMAWSDRAWVLEGAAVRVSLIGFDSGQQEKRTLNGQPVRSINPDLTSDIDVTEAEKLSKNSNLAFMGDTKQGPFDIPWEIAKKMLNEKNASGLSNRDAIKPWFNGRDIVRRSRNMWIIDFGVDMSEEEAALYEAPFEYVKTHVKPTRETNRRSWYRDEWWLHYAPRAALRKEISSLTRFIATPTVSKHRIFVWLDTSILPDHQLIVFPREDDYFFGVLHAKPHELWALRQGTSLEDRPRYTPTTTFETYPFPWPPGQEPTEDENQHVAAIAQAARDLVELRQAWLHPSEKEIQTVIGASKLKKRTLTNLYNALHDYRHTKTNGKRFSESLWHDHVDGIISLSDIDRLDYIHQQLDEAVLRAYGWPLNLSDDEILGRLLVLNAERAADDAEDG